MTSWWPGVDGYLDAVPLHDLVFLEPQEQRREAIGDNAVVTHLTGVLRAGAAAGAWTIDDPAFTALFLFHALHGSVHAAAHKERLNRARLSRAVETLFFRVLGPC